MSERRPTNTDIALLLGELRGDLNGLRDAIEKNEKHSSTSRAALGEALKMHSERIGVLEQTVRKWENRGIGALAGAGMVGGAVVGGFAWFWQSLKGLFA